MKKYIKVILPVIGLCKFKRDLMSLIIILVFFLTGFRELSAQAVISLNIDDVRQMALKFNRTYLSALEDVVKAESEIMVARAGVLPEVTINSYYSRNIKLPSFFLNPEGSETIEFKAGFKNDFGASLSLRQSIWKGGRVFNAWKIAKQYDKYSQAGAKKIKAEIIHQAELLFYTVILEQSNLEVLQKAYESNSYNLEVVEKYYSQGLVSEFEVLRAKVEKSNLKPLLLKSESDVRLSNKRLKSFLGIDLNEETNLIDKSDDTSMTKLLPLTVLLESALKNRPEIQQAEYLVDITKNAVSVVRSDYYPELEAVSTYSWSSQSDDFTLANNNVQSWSAGINLTIPIFKGGETRGEVKKYKADYQQAILAAKETRDMVRLEVEESYDLLLQAKKAVEIQGETIAQAEEGLKIANLRYESGVGTLLEVLSAQTALTEARNALAQAIFIFRKAKSQIKKATTVDIN